ncbi:alpha/beta fold hydrolase [Hansschlegelia quercus]|uniref:Alpha/beta hydrolase n=1 Tax=Hansschlegelia quercus TaxID=2528245 RepID=A0A4Q9GQM8_9HYPH|nr:alpha/beta hydrolase [Hansschlegelia quercus]TBN55114.1 alpha/beta hydrolase [Hansschlegelia quercus]
MEGALVQIPGAQAPEGAQVRILVAADGVKLRAAFWRPKGVARGTVCLFHGRIEFIEKYGEVVADLLARGFAVATLDYRGQGGSERLLVNPFKGHVGDFAEYRADAEALMRQVALIDCPAPYFALAHSMSAPVVADLISRQPQWFERAVLVAPMIGLPLRPTRFFAQGLASGLSRLGLSEAYIPSGSNRLPPLKAFAGNPVTSDPKRYAVSARALTIAPDLGVAAPTIGWVAAAFRAMIATSARGFPESLRTPTLVITAGRDRIVDPVAGERFARRLTSGGHVLLRGALHEIMLERDDIREQFWAAFDAFVPGRRQPA